MIAFVLQLVLGVCSSLIAGVLLYLCVEHRPFLHRCLSAIGASAKSALLWRQTVAVLMPVWAGGAVWSFILTCGMDSAPMWALAWYGSVTLAVLWYIGWLAVRWAVRQTRRLTA